MGTVYIRNVDDAVITTLKERAAAAGVSLSAYLGAELGKLASRPTNAELVARLRERDRSTGPTTEEIVAEIRAARRSRTQALLRGTRAGKQ